MERLLSLLLLTLGLIFPVLAQDSQPTQLQIFNTSSAFNYIGCHNETVDLANSRKQRTLDGPQLVLDGAMTVPACLDFCSRNGSYTYAGVEFSRECYCGNNLLSLAAKVPDGECNTACDGNKTVACGGPLKLSIYQKKSGASAPWGASTALLVVSAMIGSLTWL